MILLLLAVLIAYWADHEYGGDNMEAVLCSWAMCLVLVATATPASWDISQRMATGAIVALILVVGFDKVKFTKREGQNV